MSRAHELCLAAISAGKTRQQIAIDTGYSRTAISLYLSGKYPTPGLLEEAICKAYDRITCLHIAEIIEPAVCHKKAFGPKPFGGAERLAWWTTCQSCPHKPEVSK